MLPCMNRLNLIAALPLALAMPVAAQEEEPVTPASIVAASAPEEWVEIAPEDILIMRLADDGSESPRDVVIQLMPPPFSQPWVANIRTLARAHWWDGTSVYRVVDNWVTQWGDVSEEKALPEGVVSPVADYTIAVSQLPRVSSPSLTDIYESCPDRRHGRCAAEDLPPAARQQLETIMRRAPMADHYSELAMFRLGWPLAMTREDATAWPIHCYAHVGVARDIESTGTGSELYAVIGHAPRQLDRNIAVVGRVIEGMEHLSTLRRGTGEAGVYESREEDTRIKWVRLASDEEESEHWRYEYLSTDSDSFAAYVESRSNRNDPFYTVPAGGVDICNVQVPIRWIDPEGEG